MEKFEEFKNNIFCRRDSNQHKAHELWKEINIVMDTNDKKLFETEWSHYTMGELDIDDFSFYFNQYVKRYYLS